MPNGEQPDLDGRRRLHMLIGLVILLTILAFLIAFFVSYWRSGENESSPSLFGSRVAAEQPALALSERAEPPHVVRRATDLHFPLPKNARERHRQRGMHDGAPGQQESLDSEGDQRA